MRSTLILENCSPGWTLPPEVGWWIMFPENCFELQPVRSRAKSSQRPAARLRFRAPCCRESPAVCGRACIKLYSPDFRTVQHPQSLQAATRTASHRPPSPRFILCKRTTASNHSPTGADAPARRALKVCRKCGAQRTRPQLIAARFREKYLEDAELLGDAKVWRSSRRSFRRGIPNIDSRPSADAEGWPIRPAQDLRA
jgi:hypothetical protein